MDMKRFEGLTIEDLEAAIIAMKKAEEAKKAAEEAKREAKLDDARLAMLDAAMQYLLLLGVIDEEELQTINVSNTLDELKEAEGQIVQYAKFFKRIENLPFTNNDIEILEKFLRTV